MFGVGLAVQPLEGQERLSPVITTEHSILKDSGGPGLYRGGCGVQKGGTLTRAEGAVISYACDRARSVVWGIGGGLPSIPHGVWLNGEFLGAVFSNVDVKQGDVFTRPSAGGGGYGDPLARDPEAVKEDVADDYVSIERALKDYGVVICELDADLALYEVDAAATAAARAGIRAARKGWLSEPAEGMAARYRAGELDAMDCLRQHGVILDWGTGALFPNTTVTFREMLHRRAVPHWA